MMITVEVDPASAPGTGSSGARSSRQCALVFSQKRAHAIGRKNYLFAEWEPRLASTLVVEFSGGSAVSDCGAVEVAIGPVG